jgi:hypothetical protein
LLLYALALGVRLVLLAGHADPGYPDSFYYVDVARELAAGNGFSIDVVWVFAEVGGRIPADPVLPIPSNAHWMPLASLVQVPFIWLLGPTATASALPFALIGALAAPLTWAVARDAGAREVVAIGAGMIVATPVLMAPFMAQPDNFSLYQPLVVGALWAASRGLHGDARAYVTAGLLVGVATLARNDGVLVGAAVGLVFAWDRWQVWRSNRRVDRGPATGGGRVERRRPRIPVWAAVGCFALFLAVVAPWYARQLAVFGELSPSTASGKVLFIREIAEWNSIVTPADLDWFLGQGLGPLVASRVGGLIAGLGIFSTLVLGGLLVPFVMVGAWLRRRSAAFGPWFAYAALLFVFSALVSAVHVPGGTFIHSAVALAPQAWILALEAILAGVAWIAARRATWDADAAGRVFVGAAVAFAAVATVIATLSVHGRWDRERDERLAVATALDAAGASPHDRLMSIDASGYRYYTGRGGVVLVNDPLPTIERVARAYEIRWLVLEADSGVPAVAPILDGARPAWVGAPILQLPSRGATAAPEPGTGAAPEPGASARPGVALYPVCIATADPRCQE